MQVSSARSLASGLGVWLWWVLASTAGWAVGGPVGVALGSFGGPKLSRERLRQRR
jgi:hypothetical protein